MIEPKILVCGSMAFDTIMVFRDRFAKYILPNQTHVLNVAFQVDDLRREWGGCAGNMAYNLKALGANPIVMATIGQDGEPYRARLESWGIDTTYLRTIPNAYTAQAFITTDLEDNQITAFHPGAMYYAHENAITRSLGATLAIVAPDGREGMIRHLQECHAASIPVIFDPGQGLPLFSGPELLELLPLADYLTVNDYEAKLIEEKTGQSIAHLAKQLKALVVTKGSQGSEIWVENEKLEIPVVPARQIIDPTGCGDAYRAGLLYGISRGWSWQKTGRLATLLGSIKVAARGGQNHILDRQHIDEHYRQVFGENL